MSSTPVFSLDAQLSKPVVIFPSLMRYHTLERGPKYPPNLSTLPFRTYLVNRSDFDAMALAQMHAFYEEIESIAAGDAGGKSPFGHLYIIHPPQEGQVRALSTEVLEKSRDWIGEKGMYVGTHHQVGAFREKRGETLEVAGKELWKREVAEVRDEEGMLERVVVDEEDWAVVGPGGQSSMDMREN